MVVRFNLKKFIISVVIPLAVGGISAIITRGNMDIYSQIVRPPLSPPSILFPIVWTVLYTLMGVSLYIVWNSDAKAYKKQKAFIIFAIQLFLNFIWSPIFFNMQRFLLAFVVLVFLWIFAIVMTFVFYKISKPAGLLQTPYILWLTFAGYLNLAIYLLN